MKTYIKGAVVAAAAVMAMAVPSFADDYAGWTGRQIMDESARRHETDYEYEEQIMTLIDDRGNEEAREVRRFSRKMDDGLFRYLMVFDSPAGVKGVALLTHQVDGADDDQWVSLPAAGGKLKRQARGSKRNYFMGTDFANEDLVSEDRAKFKYERLEDATIDGEEYFVVRSFPEAKDIQRSTGYKYRDLYIRKDIFLTQFVDFYDRRGNYLKRQETSDLVQVEGEMYRANYTVMKRFAGGDPNSVEHQTVVVLNGRSFDEGDVPEDVFTARYIERGRHMR